jgi:hypothetical protein
MRQTGGGRRRGRERGLGGRYDRGGRQQQQDGGGGRAGGRQRDWYIPWVANPTTPEQF